MGITAWRGGKSGIAALRDVVISDCYRFVSRTPKAGTPESAIRRLLGMSVIPRVDRKSQEELRITQSGPGRFLVSVTSTHERIQSAWRRMEPQWKIRRIVVPSAKSPQLSIEDHYQHAGGLAKKNPLDACGSRGFAIVYRGGLPTLGKRR